MLLPRKHSSGKMGFNKVLLENPMTQPTPSPTVSFEEALLELERVVKHLEDGRMPLEESLKLYERGSALKAFCEDKLKSARLRIEEIVKDGENAQVLRPSPLADPAHD